MYIFICIFNWINFIKNCKQYKLFDIFLYNNSRIFFRYFYKKRYLFPVQWVFRRSNQDRCTGNGKADRCDDLPGLSRTLTTEN